MFGSKSSANATSDSSVDDFFKNITISSEGMVYGKDNFANDEYTNKMFREGQSNSYTYIGALYTNSNLTLYISDILKNETSIFKIETTSKYIDFNSTTGNYSESLDITEDNILNIYKTDKNAFDYCVFEMDYNNPQIQRIHINFTYYEQTYLPDGASQLKAQTRNYVFIVIQQDLNFTRVNPITYKYTTQSIPHIVSEMKTGGTYPKVDLKIPNGTAINPIYINFIKNGINYVIYNIDGVFYNDLGDSTSTYARTESTITLENSTLPLNQSGIYEISIYDRASMFVNENKELNLTNPNANIQKDSFLINTDETLTYLTAESSSGKQIANKQTTNEDVVVKLYNVSTANVASLTLRKSNSNTTTSTSETWTTNFPTSFSLTEDYVYTFNIVYKSHLVNQDSTKYAPFTYLISIIKDIRSTYTTSTGERLEATGTNEIQTKEISESVQLEYGYGIRCDYNQTYNVQLANSIPDISGIENNGSIDGAVNLTIYGVGQITVKISIGGGAPQEQVVTNGTQIPLSAAGDYHVEVIDEMNVATAKNFTIGVQMNTATIALIAVGALLIVAVILFILKNRAKVSVK